MNFIINYSFSDRKKFFLIFVFIDERIKVEFIVNKIKFEIIKIIEGEFEDINNEKINVEWRKFFFVIEVVVDNKIYKVFVVL